MEVSVVVPVYNVENSLPACIDSILSQTYKDYEIILVDDGAKDESAKICDAYAEKSKKIKVIHKQNGGLSSARKTGFHAAMGKYICFIDSDDRIYTTYLEDMIEAIEKEDADLAICGYTWVQPQRSIDVYLPYNEKVLDGKETVISQYLLTLVGKPINKQSVPGFVWTRMYLRERIYEDFFKSEREYFMEDHIFNLEYASNINKVAIVNKPLYYYEMVEGSLTNRHRDKKWGMYKKLFNYMQEKMNAVGLGEVARPEIKYFVTTAAFDCVDNACRGQSFAEFRKEIQQLKYDEEFRRCFDSIELHKFHMTELVTFYCMKIHLYYLLYLYRRWRMAVAWKKG